MRAVAFVPLVACYAPVPPSGVECSAAGDCPAPFRCIDGFCGGSETPPDDAVIDAAEPDATDAPTIPIDAPLVCPQGYAMNAFGSCYQFVNVERPWPTAENDCENDGAHLVVVETQAEADALAGDPRWIGVSDRVTDGTFRAVTGAIITFENFANGEPSGGNQDCIHTTGGSPAVWRDGPCDFPFGYVCEFDGRAADPNAF